MIFNKSANGAAELKSLIGFIYKSVTFENLRSYLEFAARDLQKIIGPEIYQQAEEHYLSDHFHWVPPTPEEGEDPEAHPEYAILDELVHKIQYPLAVHAYRMYAPSSDLTHSDKGRQIFVSEQEKPAFEWQIEKDNENLCALANKATDILLEWLDEHKDDPAPAEEGAGQEPEDPEVPSLLLVWKDSDAYLASKDLFINTTEQMEDVFPIAGSRVTFLALVPFLRRCQHNEILPVIGKTRYDNLLSSMVDESFATDETTALLEKVRGVMGLMALSVAVKRLSAQVLPDGIFTSVVSGVIKGKNKAEKIDRNEVSSSLEKDARREMTKLQEYLRKLDLLAAGETYTETDTSEHIDETLKFVRL